MIRSLLSRLSLFLLAAGLLVPSALAQDVDPSKSEISEVATLRVKIEKVRAKYGPKIDKAEGADENKKLQRKQEKDIEEVLSASDEVSSDRYYEIMQAAQSDKTLQKKIMKKVKKERKRLKE